MKTKHIPALIALAAGLITCIISFLDQVSVEKFARNLCLVIVLFYIFGCVIKLIFDKNFPPEVAEAPEEEAALEGEEQEETPGEYTEEKEEEKREEEKEEA